ncbi:hypothetical protein [Streptomyces spinosirectus]
MQWTDESGVTYGGDPYDGVGHAYPCADAHSGAATADTATLAWDTYPMQAAQWTYPMDDVRAAETAPDLTGSHSYVTGSHPYAVGTHLYATGTRLYAAEPQPATTAWGAPHGDVLTVPPSELDPFGLSAPGTGTGAGAETPRSEPVRPVFADSSGRRQRRVRRAARLVVIPAGGYVALLISTVLGGPSLSAPFVPQPDSTHPPTPHASAPDSAPGPGHSAAKPSPTAVQDDSRPTAASTTSGATARSTASTTPAATSAPATASTAVAAPSVAPDPGSRGRALGSSHKPVK